LIPAKSTVGKYINQMITKFSQHDFTHTTSRKKQ
jgi:hypothetical protein